MAILSYNMARKSYLATRCNRSPTELVGFL